MRWIAEKDFGSDFREVILPNLASLESAGATPLKHTVTRSVYKLKLVSGAVFIKHHKPDSLREKVKYLVLRSRAYMEWTASHSMAERGIPAARALAVGERRVAGILAEAVLVTAEIPDAVPLQDELRRLGGNVATGDAFRAKRELLRKTAQLVRTMNDRGVLHRDLHGGNILVSRDQLFLIDLHRVTIGGAPPRRRRISTLAQLLAYIPGLVTCGDRLFFVREYLGDSAPRDTLREVFGSVSRTIIRLREQRYASRTKRCVRKSTGFAHEHTSCPDANVYRRADFPADLVRQAVEAHHAAAGGNVLKSDGRTRVTVVEAPADPRKPSRLCIKEFIRQTLLQRIEDIFKGSKALHAWIGSNACSVRGIGTPAALAIAECGPSSFLVTEHIEGGTRFNDYVADKCRPADRDSVRRWRAFIKQAADFVRLLHSHRLCHRDLSAKNILVREREGGWDFFLVDVGDIRLGHALSLKQKIKNLGQLDQIYVKPSRTDRLRFYRHYSRGKPEFDRPEFLAQIDAISRARHAHWLEFGGKEILEERRRHGKPV